MEAACSKKEIVAKGFEISGLCPWNPEAVAKYKLKPGEIYDQDTLDKVISRATEENDQQVGVEVILAAPGEPQHDAAPPVQQEVPGIVVGDDGDEENGAGADGENPDRYQPWDENDLFHMENSRQGDILRREQSKLADYCVKLCNTHYFMS